MSRRGKKPPAGSEVKTALSRKRERQLESAFSVRSRAHSLDDRELLHTARAVQLLKPANWAEKWQHLRNVTLAEAVALSLGYEPGQPALEHLTEYCERMELAIRCLGEPHRFPDQSWERSPIDLTKFVTWAQSVDDWDDLPDELKKLATPTENKPNLAVQEPALPDKRERRDDVLWPAIRKAQDIADDNSVAAVFNALKCMALDEVPPFTGHVPKGALQYTDVDNKVRHFTRHALRKRLRRKAVRDDGPVTAANDR